MYEQVDMNDEEIERVLISKIDVSRVDEYYKYCQCKDMENMSKMCRATLLLNLHGFKKRIGLKFSVSHSGLPLLLHLFFQ